MCHVLQRPKNRPPQQIREAKSRRDDMQKFRLGKEFVQELSKPTKSSPYEGQARPSSLELNQYAATDGACLTEEQYMRQRTCASNGPTASGAQAVPQYQPPPPYDHHPSPPPYTPKDYSSANFQQEYAPQTRSPVGTPTRRSAVNRGPSSVGGIRPTEAPPMPPGVQQAKFDSPMGSRSGSASRESLPPPPLPPPLLPGEHPMMGRVNTAGMSPIHVNTIQQQGSPVRHTPSPQQLRNATPDSGDLPLPSPPPLPSDTMPNNMQAMPLPPLLPGTAAPGNNIGVPLPPPLPPPAMPDASKPMPNGNVLLGQLNAVTLAPPADNVSISSNMSSTTMSSNSTVNAVNHEKPAATIGCDLLNAIRDG